jgi:Zn-dependent protease with chaperone function
VNFFERQHQARRKTMVLVAYFALAVALIVVAINVAVYWILKWSGAIPPQAGQWMEQPYFAWITVGVVAVILVGSLVSVVRLAAGGKAVAEMAGARRIDPSTRDADERKFINVVEEMSIASGTPVPALYVMDEEAAINAFVAGYRPDSAVLVVTQGALAALNRDELQGVIGHEYSHILNGDMRINVRLLSILAGIVLLGHLGELLLRSLRHTGRSGGSRSEGQLLIVAVALGAALFVLGYIGLFFGRLIKAAISRQREFLADASAVQFTRNPEGIAGALWTILKHGEGSVLVGSHAEDMSHMCFGESVRFRFGGLFATHPPLETRIKSIDAGFIARQRDRARAGKAVARAEGVRKPRSTVATTQGLSLSAAAITASVGNPTAQHVEYAREVHGALPTDLLEAAHAHADAQALLCALIMRETQPGPTTVARLEASGVPAAVLGRARILRRSLEQAGVRVRLPLVNIALATLKSSPAAERSRVRATVAQLVALDAHTTMFEFVLLALVDRQLAPDAERADSAVHFKFDPVNAQIRILLSTLARAGGVSEVAAQAAFARAMAAFDRNALQLATAAECTVEQLTAALAELSGLAPILKRSLISACADCVLHDGQVLPAEAELLRATAETLDCPMPPLLPAAA